MSVIGNTDKMDAVISSLGVVNYTLKVGDAKIDMNALIGKSITIRHTTTINCTACGRVTKESYRGSGFCRLCSNTLAKADACRISPEKCHYEAGTCREPKWGEQNCLTPHIVYVSDTGQRKIGITRHANDEVSSRWIDQGATSAVAIISTSNRFLSGEVEVICKKYISDRTNWRKMLQDIPSDDIMEIFIKEFKALIYGEIEELRAKHGLLAIQWIENPIIQNINYPVLKYPTKVKSVNLDKLLTFTGTLCGIKGQYFLFDDDSVMNIRKYAGYEIELTVND